MPATKQQRRIAAGSKAKASQQRALSSITNFARVSKTGSNGIGKKELGLVTPKKDTKLEAITPASRKRKVIASIEDDASADEGPSEAKAAPSSTRTSIETPSQPAKRGRGRPPKKARPEPTPRKRVRSPSISDSDASNLDAGALFKRLRLESSPSRFSSPLTADTSVAGSDAESDTTPTKPSALPREVLDIIDLHTALLKILTLHYAHHASTAAVYLRELLPNITRAWGKRKVTNADIHLCLGILNCSTSSPGGGSNSPLVLVNYGRGICIDLEDNRNFGPQSETQLNAMFRANITASWKAFCASEDATDVLKFLNTLPKAEVTQRGSAVKGSYSVLSKGQQRLEDLKHGIAIKKQEKAAAAAAAATKPLATSAPADVDASMTGTATPEPKVSLLDRIRLKSAQKAALPAGLTPAQLERRAALQRVEEVSALVAMLSRASTDGNMGGRVSFAMPALVDKLKDSLRMGISRPEGALCIRLLAGEVAPEWVRVVVVGGREMVVVDVAQQLGKQDVARRVQGVLGREGA
ncbi:hypothetical protein F4777DRAFT_189348 [Nemania sp. FL0916]|nr:hypothetical protein F4777DRAFT_189348 [Nemania sp. FL0916]